jgi:hypothetical protein
VKTIILLTCAFIVLTSTNSFGQSINTGIKVGLNSAFAGGKYADNIDLQHITTLNAGAYAEFDLFGFLSLQPELLYTMKGYRQIRTSFPTSSTNFIPTWNISYLEIPVLLKLNIPSSSFGIIKPNVFAGPEVAFRLTAKVKDQVMGQPPQGYDVPNINSTDFGIIFGTGADINLPIMTLMLDIRYDLGIRNPYGSQNSSAIVNRVISFNAGIGI